MLISEKTLTPVAPSAGTVLITYGEVISVTASGIRSISQDRFFPVRVMERVSFSWSVVKGITSSQEVPGYS